MTDTTKGTVLLVEDDEFLRSLIVRKLAEEGYAVTIAKDGEEALMHLGSALPDLMLLDLVLPGFSGFELVAKLREQGKGTQVPFMVLSNSAESQNREQAEELGAADYLVKAQSTPSDIVARIDTWFAQHHAA